MKLIGTLLATWLVAFGTRVSGESAPPNILLVVADDMGWTDAGFAGSKFYETPNLDALAAGGLRATSFYGSSVGDPGWATLLTGQDSPRTGVYGGDPVAPGNRPPLPPGRGTIGTALKSAGYVTGFMGIWGFGNEGDNHPSKRGFDETVVTSPVHLGFSVLPPAEIPPGIYLADFLTDRALDFLDRNKAKPFFLVLSHYSVHMPTEPKRDWVARFEKKPPAGGHRDAAYAAMIAGLDEGLGRLLGRIETLGLTSRTVVVFTSDNGGLGGYVDSENAGRRSGVTDNAPLRAGKATAYEGGMRVPFLVRWPGVVQAGSRTTHPIGHVDIFPTLCEVAGVKAPEGHVVDGLSLLSIWRNPGGHLGRDALFWHFPYGIEAPGPPPIRTPPVGIVRAGNFKLIENLEDGRVELYNVVDDLGEKDNLVRSLPDKAAELKSKGAAWRKSVGAPKPTGRGASVAAPPSPPVAAPAPGVTPASTTPAPDPEAKPKP